MVCLDYEGSVECSVCHEATPDGYREVGGKIICDECFDKKDDKQKIIRANNPPSDSGIYIKRLEETLLSCFGQWRQLTAALYKYLGERDCEKVKDVDCIEWFCSDMKSRLTELKKQGRHPGLWRFG